MKKNRFLMIIPVFGALWAAACAPERPTMDKVLERFQAGDVVLQVERAYDETTAKASEEDKSASNGGASQAPLPQVTEDPCPQVGAPTEDSTEKEWDGELKKLSSCLRELIAKEQTWKEAIRQFKTFKSPQAPHSSMKYETASRYFNENSLNLDELFCSISKSQRLRSDFSDSDLLELELLSQRRKQALAEAEPYVYAAVRNHRALIEHYSPLLDRYAALLALADTEGDLIGNETARALMQAFKKAEPWSESLFSLLHPFALSGVIPAEGREFFNLHFDFENPFTVVKQAIVEMAGSHENNIGIMNSYKSYRNKDNPPFNAELPVLPENQIVRVAFIDTGIDFVEFPELGHFLDRSSYDYADGDENPWLPARAYRDFLHGSGTVATLLTLISHFNPQNILDQSVRIGFWKFDTLRSMLSRGTVKREFWESRSATQNILLDRTENTLNAPKIVSASVSANWAFYFKKFKKTQNIKSAPWLWVMSAGNNGTKLSDASPPSCLSDFDPAVRPKDNLLCVGALNRDDKEVWIAPYSNFGEDVDLYAFDNYNGLCPSGTSCSTPVVTAAATLIAARNPKLTPAQIKTVLMEVSVEQTLFVGRPARSKEKRTIRFIDPILMMDKAFEKAAALSAATPQKN